MGVHCWLIVEAFDWNPVRAFLKIAISIAVALMQLKDSPFHRWWAFVFFSCGTPLIALVNLFYFQNMLADNIIWARDTCELL